MIKTIRLRSLSGCLLTFCTAMSTLPAWSGDTAAKAPCNPTVRIAVDNASLHETLSGLSREHGFSLVFPPAVDRPVSLNDELALDGMLKKLTSQVSTSFMYLDDAGCEGGRLAKLVVYPVGEKGQRLPVSGVAGDSSTTVPDEGYIYIEDMDRYAEEVLLRKRKPELSRMTPEQRTEYRHAKRRMKKLLEPKLKSGELKRERKGKQESTAEGSAEKTESGEP